MSSTSRTILLVDDSPEDRELYRRYLLRDPDYTYTILEASLGQQGLELWQQHPVDAVLIDYRLPDRDGLEVLCQLQAYTQQLCLPAIMVTGEGSEAIAVQAMKAGAQDYLIKGHITPTGLQLAVNGVIQTAQLHAQLQQHLDRERLVAQITQKIHQTLDLQEILQTTVTEVRQFLQTDRIFIYRFQPDFSGIVVVESVGDNWQSLLHAKVEDQYFIETRGEDYRQGRLQAVADVYHAGLTDCHINLLAQFQIRANLVVPILQGEALWGLLVANHCSGPREWQTLEINLLQQLAAQAGIALHQAELYQQSQNELAERSRAEAELRESEQRYAALAQVSPVGIFRTNVEGDCLYTNARWCELTGLTLEQAQGEGWIKAIHPSDRDRICAAWYRATESNSPFLAEYRFQTPEGQVSWVIGQAIAEQDAEGHLIGYVGTVTDITERKQFELTLRDKEQQLQQLSDSMPQFVWISSPNGQIEYVNRKWCEYSGMSLEESREPEYVKKLFHPDDIPQVFEQWEICQEPQQIFESEARLRRASDGAYRWFLIRAIPGLNDQGEVRWFGTSTDIHDSKQAQLNQQFLNGLELRLRQLSDANAMLWEAMSSLGEYLNVDRCIWHRVDADTGIATIEQDWRRHEVSSSVGVYRLFELMLPDLIQLCQSGQPIVISDVTVDPYTAPFAANYLPYGTRAFVAVPCMFAGRWVATLGINSVTAREWRSDEVTLLQEAVTQLWSLIEQTHAVQALRESEARFRTLADNISQMAWMTDETGSAIWYNQRWFDYTGTTAAEVHNWGWQQVHHPDHVERVSQGFQNSLESGEPWEDTFPLRGRDGQYRWFLSRAIPVRDEQGQVCRWFGTNTDITERQEAEEKLQRSEAEFRTIANAAPALVWVCSTAGAIIFMNDRWYEYTGQSLDETLGFGWANTMHPDDALRTLSYWQQCCQTGQPYEGEVRYRRKDGEYRWHRFRALPQRNESGSIEKWFGCSIDVHDAKQAEAALQRSEDRLRIALESAQLGTWDYSPITDVLTWDAQSKRMWGLPPDAEVNHSIFFASLHPDDRDRIHKSVQQALDPVSSGIYEAEYRITDQAGSLHWIAAKGQVYFSPSGEPVRFIGTMLDITDRKQAEIERERLLERERSARAEAERANRVKDEFLAVLSHELRSPLNPILGWTKLLQTRTFDSARTLEALATIERNAKLQTQLIDDLLDIAKILRGKLSMEVAPVDLGFVIEAAIDTVRAAATAKSIVIHPILPQIGQVSGDATRLQQIVWNLLSNAIKFTPAGGRVDVKLEKVERSAVEQWKHEEIEAAAPITHYAQITVTDTGKGITVDFLPHIFESFRQEDASTTRKYGGLGLGLAIVRHLIEAHGGMIRADSLGEGKGATFTVRLPLLTVEPEPHPPENLSNHDLDLTGIRILTVDDEPDARELLNVILTQYGAEVLTVDCAAAVLTHLQSFQPHVLVSDIGMPRVDGYSLIQQVRALPPEQGGQLPAIALTAYAREEDYQQAIRSGFQGHITKPIEPEALIRAVSALTRQNRCESDTASASPTSKVTRPMTEPD